MMMMTVLSCRVVDEQNYLGRRTGTGTGTGDGNNEEKQFYPGRVGASRSRSRGGEVEDVGEKEAGMTGAEGQGRTKLLTLKT